MVTTVINASSTGIGQWDPLIDNFTQNSGGNPAGDVFVRTPTSFVVRNADGTFTRVTGVGLTYDVNNVPNGGTITLIEHASASVGGTVFATINNLVAANNSAAIVGGFLFTQNTEGLGGYLFSQSDVVTTADADGTDWSGEAGNDLMTGGAGNDVFDGGNGNDTLIGGGGDNALNGLGGNDLLIGGAGADTLLGGDGLDILRGLGGGDLLDGGAGNDRADYRNSTVGIIADLFNSLNNTGDAAGDVYISIEGLVGGSGDDELRGDAGNNFFFGGEGADTIDGGSSGFDTAQYNDATAGITVSLADPSLNTGEAAGDVYVSIEHLAGSNDFNDLLIGDEGSNFLRGNGGADTLDGGDGFDSADYSFNFEQTAGVTVNLANPGLNTGEAVGDVYISIEGLVGTTNFGDALVGDDDNNFLRGLGGADTLDGGLGIDTADYLSATSGVSVNLTLAIQAGGEAGGDQFTSIESLRGSNFADTLIGDNNANVLLGAGGNDTLNGGGGADTLIGGNGFDVFIGGSGNDTFNGGDPNLGDSESVPYERLSGGLANYATTGTGPIAAVFSTTQTVTGGTGIDTDTLISVQQVRGTIAGDTFTVDSNYVGLFLNGFAEFEGMGGNDTITGNGVNTRISFSQSTAGVSVDLLDGSATGAEIGTDSFSGVTQVRGSSGADTITGAGMSGDLFFIGQGGNDTITGSGLSINNFDSNTADFSSGAAGESISVVAGANTIVTGGASLGTDTLIGVPLIRGTNANDTYTVDGSFTGPNGPFNEFEGMAGNDTIIGNGSTRIAFSRAIAGVTVDLALGTASSFNNAADIGTDTFSGVNNVRGSNYGDTFLGSNGAQAERFRGQEGADTIDGGGGTLDGVDYGRDISGVSVNLATGIAIDGWGDTDTLSNVEGARGSEFNDTLVGNGVANILMGQNGDDSLSGGGGNDFLEGDDLPSGLSPYGVVFGIGTQFDSGNDTLDGGAGTDTMYGGKGNDLYLVDAGGDAVNEFASEGTDTVRSTVSFVLSTNVERLELQGSANINGTGNTLANQLIGNSGNNSLDGGVGADTLVGGAGDDTYTVDSVGDVISEGVGAGNDLVRTHISLLNMASGVERATMLGTADLSVTGNNLANTIFGNSGNNTLDGGNGADTMGGGAGNDTYFVTVGTDVVSEASGAGTDTVMSSVTYTLSANVENLTLTGTAVVGIGNLIANTLTGNAVANQLNGGVGTDTMIGGDGNDVYLVDNVGDVVTEIAGQGVDTVQSTVTYTLSAEVDRLFLTGAAAINGTGNDLQNVLLGNSAANMLSGQGGNDLIYGELGNDTLTGGSGLDAFYFRTALDESTNLDVITDFSTADDRMFIDNAVFTGLANGALAASAFATGPAATDASDRIIYDPTNGAVYFDVDGLDGAAQVQFASLLNLPLNVTAQDFFVF